MTTTACAFDGCFRFAARVGLCHTHYMQQRRGKPLTPIRPYGAPKPEQPRRIERPSTVRDELGRKRCNLCTQWLVTGQFYADPRAFDQLSSHCGKCSNLSRFKLTRTSYEALLAGQGNACAFCRKPQVRRA